MTNNFYNLDSDALAPLDTSTSAETVMKYG